MRPLLERGELQREVLAAGGDAGVADPLSTAGRGVTITLEQPACSRASTCIAATPADSPAGLSDSFAR